MGLLGGLAVGALSLATLPDAAAGATPVRQPNGSCGLCVLAPSGQSLTLTGNGSVSLSKANVVVNSSGRPAVSITGNGSLLAPSVGVVGGVSGHVANLTTGIAPIEDPLAGLAVPSLPVPAKVPSLSLNGQGSAKIAPGVYDEISITGQGQLTLEPGTYVIRRQITATGNGSLTASGVTLYLACSHYPAPCKSGEQGASLSLTGKGSLNLSGPTAQCSPVAIFADPNNTAPLTLTGNGGLPLNGIVYAKSGSLSLTGNGALEIGGFVDVGRASLVGNGNVSIRQGFPLSEGLALSLSASSTSPHLGEMETLTATLTCHGKPLAGQPVKFTVTGANPNQKTAKTDSSGKATFSDEGRSLGTDTVQATFTAPGIAVTSAPVEITWLKGLPSISTSPVESSVELGGALIDNAKVTGGLTPTGEVSWNVYAASDTTCKTPLNGQPLTAQLGNQAAQSPTYLPVEAGTYQFVASYEGDASNRGAATKCGDKGEQVVVTPPAPGLAAVSTTTVEGNFFAAEESAQTFTAKPGDTPVFGQSFPTVNFNPPAATLTHALKLPAVDPTTRPFTDVTSDLVGNPNGVIVAQGNGQQAGVGNLQSFDAEFTSSFNVSKAGEQTITVKADDGFLLGIGGGATRVSGEDVNPPSSGTTPFKGYPIVGAFNQTSGATPQTHTVTADFPHPGSYPYELDYFECCGQQLSLTLGTATAETGSTPFNVFAGYADTVRPAGSSTFPNPWQGSENTTFVGSPAPDGTWDTGALRLDNPTDSPQAVEHITVDIGSTHFDPGFTNITVAPKRSAVLAGTGQLVSGLPTGRGGIYITGHDPDYHAYQGGNAAGAQNILKRAVNWVTFGNANPKILLVTDLRNPGGDESDPRNGLTAAGFTYDIADDGSSGSALDLHTVDFRKYSVVVVASDYGGWLRQEELDILNARSADLISYINGGGGLVALAECGCRGNGTGTTHDRFGFLPSVVSSAALNQGESGFTLTSAGTAMGLATSDVNGNASHNIFTAGGGLEPVDLDSAGHIISLTERGQQVGTSNFDTSEAVAPASSTAFSKLPGPGSSALLAGTATAASASLITTTDIATGFDTPIAVDYYQPLNQMLLSVNYSGGQPNNFDLVDSTGTHGQFSAVAGLTDEVYMAAIRASSCNGGFKVGDVFVGTGTPGQIGRVTDGGSTFIPNWVQLPGEGGLLRGGLFQDRYCSFGGDLIVSTTAGDVWRVTSAGVPTLIATNVGDFLEGPTTVPNDPKYGPWAGTILVSSEQCGCVESVSNKGNVSVYGGYPSAEGVHVVPGGENFFGDDFADGKLVGIPASQLTSYAGDIFVATESPGNIIDVRWDSAANGGAGAFVQQPVINPVSQFEGTGFAPVGVANLPAPECSASSIVPQIHVTAGGVATTFEDKSRVLTHGGLDAEACGSRSATTTSQPTTTGFNAQPFATEFPESSGLGPIGLTFDRADNLLVTDPNNGQLYKFGPEGGVASSAQVGTGGVGGLLGIAFSKSGRLYGATSTNLGGAGSVVELDPATGSAIRTVVTGLANVDGLALDPLSGDLFASNASGGGITRISGFEGPGPISESSYAAGPYDGMVFGPDGTLFAAQYPTGIVKIAGTNQPQPAAVTNIASIPNADGIALFAPPPGQPVTRLAVNRNDGIITEVDTSATSTMLTNIVEGGTRGDFVTTGPDGCLYATQSNSVEKVTESNGACPFIPSSPTINESHDWVRIAGTSTVEHPLPPATTLTLSPAGDTEEIVGQSHTVKVAATNQAGHPLGAGVPVTLAISGANSQALTSNTEGKGIASFTYVGTKPGLDTLSATGFVAGLRTVSNAASLRWNILVPGGPSPTQSGPSPPFISTTAPTDGSMVSSPTPVTAVINPPANQTIASWEVTYENVSGGSVTKLASGTGTPPSPIATFNPTGLGAGTYAITVSATTNAGGKASALTHVIVGGQAGSGGASQTPPTVTKLEPADEAEVKRPTCVTASIDAPAGQSVASITVSVQAHSGGSPVLNLKRGNCTAAGQIAELDPTMLPNGTYTITVTATASGGGTQTATTTVAVTGNLKLGRYTTTYQDLSVPVNGFQMQVRRVYDSIDKRVGDFGVGWHVEVSSLHVSTNRALGAGGWSQYYTVCFFICHTGYKTSVPHYVTVTFPDNHQEVFDFTPGGGESLFNTATPAFTARPGTNTTSKLEDPTTSLLQYAFDGNLYVFNLFQATELYEPTRFKLTTHDGTVLVLDVNSGLVSETDRNGNSLTVDANGVRSSGGQSITFTRDSQSRITKITGPSGQTLGYGYGSGEDLSSFTDADGHETTYAYDPNHNLLKTTGPGGQPLQTLAYDGSGRLESVTDANGNTTKVSNNVSGRQQIETDPNGKLTTIYTYDELGDMLQRDQITEGKTLTTKYTYDSVGRPTGRTDPLGHTFSATYDESGDLTGFTPPSGHALSVTYNASGEPLTETNPLGKTTTFTYDSNGNLSSVTDQLEHAETYTYDGAGHVTALTNRDGKTTSYTYDSGGNLATETDPLGNTTHYSHDTSGNLTSVTDANDHTTSYVYDASGNLLSTTDPLGHTTTSTYDALNRPVSQTDPAGRTTHWTYTGAGQLASEEDPSKGITSYTYDADGNLVSSTDALGHTSHYAYDGLRQVTESVDRLGRATTYEYDRAGDQIATTDPAKHTTRLTYDGEGRLTSSADPLGKTSTYSYDAAGNQTGVKDPLGRETTYTYDAAGRKTAETDPAGHATEYAYDPNGLLTTLTDPLGGEVKFTYDADGNLIALTEADGNTTEYAYDAAGNLTKVTDPLKRTTTHTYNAANELATTTDGRKVTTTYGYDPDGELTSLEAGGQSVAYAYDSLGRRSSMTDATGTSKYTYDGVGNLTSVAAPTGTITYSYDAAQQRRTMTLPGSRQTTYGYDAASNLTSLKDWLGKTTMYSYDADGRQVGIGRPNGVNTTLSYDAAGQILSLNHDGMGGPIVHNSYTYDAAGNRASATTAAGTSKFGFDALNRLTSAAYPNGAAASYIYDAAGNRTSSTLNGKTTKATYDAAGELTSNGTTSYTYDGAGNLLTAGSSTFTWDPFGRLSNSTVGGTTTEYAYNGDGLRASAKTGSATTPYLWDTQGELPELVDDGANGYLQSEGIQEEVRRSTSAATFPLTEALGSVQALTNATGEVAGSTTYDAFGNVQSHAGTSSIFGFTGQQTDPTGLQYARARYLDPSLGRFISPDTVQPSGASSTGYNLYAYVGDNPTSAIDPSGNQTIIETAFQYLRANAATLALKGLGLCVAGAFSSLAIDLVLEEVKTHHYGGPQVGTALSGCAFNLIFGPVVCRVLSPVCRAIGGAVARVLGPIRRTIGGPIDRIISRLRGTTKGPSGPSPLRVQARPTVRNANGWLTDGNYTVRPGGNAAHLPGTSLPGKSVFYNAGNVDNLTLQAAEYADTYGLWNGAKAKVYVDGAPIGRTGSGQPTNWLNVYRDSNGIIHASPGNP